MRDDARVVAHVIYFLGGDAKTKRDVGVSLLSSALNLLTIN